MVTASLIFFALAALGGLGMATLHFTKRKIPLILPLGHGVLAATGIVLLTFAVLQSAGVGMLKIALGLFVVTALAGGLIFSYHLRGKDLPTPMIFLHASFAVIAFGLLLAAALAVG